MIPGVIYRLQNVEYGTYLEIGLATEGSPIPMRPIKEFSEKQQWTFSEVPGTSSYILRNLAVSGTDEDSVHKRMVYQAHNVQAFTATNTYDVSRAIAWIVEGDGEEYLIKFMYGNHQYRHLVCTTHETTYIVQQPYTFQTALDNAKWRLIPVWPSLPRDDYLIRNMNGLALHMSSPHPMSVRKDYTPGPLALNKEKENVHQTVSCTGNNNFRIS
ncbi:hypothetical protein B0H34DRAFT_77270 [Crassisporium funariophilum]|nr:hypothetical protein B0H34DRAFT_77270 [Crassisporium funariophilum]